MHHLVCELCCATVFACVLVPASTCERASVRASVCAHAHACAFVRACEPACVRECVRACACARVHVRVRAGVHCLCTNLSMRAYAHRRADADMLVLSCVDMCRTSISACTQARMHAWLSARV